VLDILKPTWPPRNVFNIQQVMPEVRGLDFLPSCELPAATFSFQKLKAM
jgi:hypothetical protein